MPVPTSAMALHVYVVRAFVWYYGYGQRRDTCSLLMVSPDYDGNGKHRTYIVVALLFLNFSVGFLMKLNALCESFRKMTISCGSVDISM